MPNHRADRQGATQWCLMLTTDEQTRTSAVVFYGIRWVKGLPTLAHREHVDLVAETATRGPIEAAEVLMMAAREVYGR